MTHAELISEVKGDLRAKNIDQHISGRFILRKAKGYAQDLISKRDHAKLFRDDSLFSEVKCFEMERIDSYKCPVVEFRICDKIMKSKKKLPKLFNSTVGTIIISVTNINGDVEYERLRSAADYKNTQKRAFGKHFKYYYVSEEYLYLLNSTNEIVNVVGLFSDEKEVNDASECSDCDECQSALEYEFKCPDKYEREVIDRTIMNLFNFYKRVVPDENPDGDEHQKTEKPT